MNGKLDITSYGLSEASIHFLKVLGWHLLSYALIGLGAYATGHLTSALHNIRGNDAYLPLVAATVNALISGVSRWLTSQAPTDNTLPSDFVGTQASGMNG